MELIKNKLKKTNKQKGITLIALVITIIVLLILAGVAISQITGSDSVMEKAQNAKTATDNANDEEMVKMAVVTAMADEKTLGRLTQKNLSDALEGKATVSEGVAPWTVETVNGIYTVDENGNVNKTGNKGPTVALTGIILKETNASLTIGETKQIEIQSFEPQNATDKTVTYTSDKPEVATVNEEGVVTAVAGGFATITVAGTNGVSATFTLIIDGIATASTHNSTRNLTTAGITWNKLSELSGIITNNYGTAANQISDDTAEVTIIQNGTPYIIGIGDEATVKYNGTEKIVRVIGFNHDTLVSDTSKKAGISFEFKGTMVDEDDIHSDYSGGWGACSGRTRLNGTYLGKFKDNNNVAMSTYIKQVKKTYVTALYTANTNQSTDSLWLLSCSEIWATGYAHNYGDKQGYGYATAKEGNQYKYYKNINAQYSSSNESIIKKDSSGNAKECWLRSLPSSLGYATFCHLSEYGHCGYNTSGDFGISPGFAI